MGSDVVINQVTLLFLLMLTGFIIKKIGMINGTVSKKLSEILLYVTAPAIAVTAFADDFSFKKLISGIAVFIFSLIVTAFSIGIGQVIYLRFPENIRKVLKYVTTYPNCAYMGYPVMGSLFGKDGIFYASMYVIIFNLFVWTHGVALFTGRKGLRSIRKVLLNPGIIAVFIGIIIFLFSIKLPGPLFNALESLGSMTTPLSMLIIGGLLAEISFKEMVRGWAVYYGSMIRLIVLPLLALVGVGLFGFPEQLAAACVTLVSMPAAVNTAIFTEKFDGDSAFASRCVAFTTLLSIITIPVMVFLTHYLIRYIPVLVKIPI